MRDFVNTVIEKWMACRAVAEPLNSLQVKRFVLGNQFGLRDCDVNQHLIRTLLRDGEERHAKIAKEHITEILSKLNDKEVIFKVYGSLYDILNTTYKERDLSLTAVGATDNEAELNRLELACKALEREVEEHKEYIGKLKKRSWWQRLLNLDVDIYDKQKGDNVK